MNSLLTTVRFQSIRHVPIFKITAAHRSNASAEEFVLRMWLLVYWCLLLFFLPRNIFPYWNEQIRGKLRNILTLHNHANIKWNFWERKLWISKWAQTTKEFHIQNGWKSRQTYITDRWYCCILFQRLKQNAAKPRKWVWFGNTCYAATNFTKMPNAKPSLLEHSDKNFPVSLNVKRYIISTMFMA